MLLDASKYFIVPAGKTKNPTPVKRKSESEFYIPSIPGPWVVKVFKLSSVAIKVALVLWRAYRMQGGKNPFKLTTKYSKPFGLSRYQKYRGLVVLQKAGLIEVVQKRGQAPEITLMDINLVDPAGLT